MKVLLDQNLSRRLVGALADLFADSLHVGDVGLAGASDEAVWSYAKQHGLVIVTKDADFNQRAFLSGAPPKVIWLRVGNCSTGQIEDLIRRHIAEIRAFESDADAAVLALQ